MLPPAWLARRTAGWSPQSRSAALMCSSIPVTDSPFIRVNRINNYYRLIEDNVNLFLR